MYPLSAALLGFNCFVDEAWPASDVLVTRDLPYGSNFNNVTGEVQTLLLDIYEPPLSDNRTLRPGVVLVHGGSFLSGDKTSDGEPEYATKLAQRGFVAVSIDYRLTGTSLEHLTSSSATRWRSRREREFSIDSVNRASRSGDVQSYGP